MSLRKVAALLAAFGLLVGLLGSGVAAEFTDSITATENIEVGTFACEISDASAGAVIAGDKHSVTYDAPDIMSSAAGSAPFSFTVKSSGSIPATFHVTKTTPPAPFTDLLGNPGDVTPGAGGTHVYNAGLGWPELGNANQGTVASITYTVACSEAAPVSPNDPMASTNDQNIINDWAHVTAVPGSGTVELTFFQPRAFYACFEYRMDGNTSQKISDTNFNPGIHDGLYPYKCLSTAGSSTSVTLGPTVGYVEFRMVFGAEADERFDWTRVDALP